MFDQLIANLTAWLTKLKADFILNFVAENRWQYLTSGLKTTLALTLLSTILGIALGVIVAIVRSSHDKLRDDRRGGTGRRILGFFNGLCKVYLTVIRGTPVVVQLLLGVFVIFVFMGEVMVACIIFGVNSCAYVAEIVRAGIMSIDNGQFEAGRSLGFNYVQTMWHIIIPQAFKNVLPALANEFIVLLKETSVCGYIAMQDITKGAYIIIGRTYSPFMPLIAIALIYLIMVMFFTWLVGKLERRLRSSDH